MPNEEAETTAAAPSRRTFLTRAAMGGALVGAGAAAGPFGLLTSTAGAQDTPVNGLQQAPPLDDTSFAAFAVPLELAAVAGYQLALGDDRLDGTWTELARTFQGHHQAVVDTLTEALAEGSGDAQPNEVVLANARLALAGAADQEAVLLALSEIERTLSATHLYALAGITDAGLAKVVAQVLATESQQGAALGLAGGAPMATLTPAALTTDGARTDVSESAVSPATTAPAEDTATTEPGGSSTEDGADNPDNAGETGSSGGSSGSNSTETGEAGGAGGDSNSTETGQAGN